MCFGKIHYTYVNIFDNHPPCPLISISITGDVLKVYPIDTTQNLSTIIFNTTHNTLL